VLLRPLAFRRADVAAATTAATTAETGTAEKKTLNDGGDGAVPVAPRQPLQATPAESKPQPVSAPVAQRMPPPPAASPAAAPQAAALPASAPDDMQALDPVDELAPWEDEPELPPGQRLPVLERPQARPGGAPSQAAPVRAVQAMPLRVQGAAGMRDLPRAPADGAQATPIVATEEGDFWFATVTRMVAEERISALARELALQSQLVGRDEDQWLLRVERESLGQAGSRDKLQGALAAVGHSVKIAIEIGAVNDSPARRNKAAAEARQRAAEEAIHADPLVQRMMREFDARIVPGSLRPL